MRLLRLFCLALAFATPLAAPRDAHAQAAKPSVAVPKAAAVAAATGLIDINSASAEVLKGIPGIGDAYAVKIKDRIIAKQ